MESSSVVNQDEFVSPFSILEIDLNSIMNDAKIKLSQIDEEASNFCSNLQEVLDEKSASSSLLEKNIHSIEATIHQFMKSCHDISPNSSLTSDKVSGS